MKRRKMSQGEATILALQAGYRASDRKSQSDSFYQSMEQVGDKAEWNRLKTEEAAELEKQRKSAPQFSQVATAWSKSFDTIMAERQYAMGLYLDPAANLPQKEKSTVDLVKAEACIEQIQDSLEAKGISLNTDGWRRTVAYGGINSDATVVKDGVEYCGAIDTPEYWIASAHRLADLGAYAEGEYTLIEQPQAPTPRVESADEQKTVAESDFLDNHFSPLWGDFLTYLNQKFSFIPSASQARAFLDFVVAHNLSVLNHESFNIARRALVRSGVLPDSCLDADDRLCIEMDSIDTSTAQGRAEYARRKNRLIYRD